MVNQADSQPTITVMMPCCNNSAFIRAAMQSVLTQQIDCAIELLIVDDASSDDSVEKIQSVNDPRVQLVRNSVNRGIASVRNQLLEAARGEYVTSLDGDDLYVSPTKLASEYDIIQQFPKHSPVVVYSNVELLDGSGQRIGLASESLPPHEGLIFQGLFDRRIMIPRDFLLSSWLARRVGGFDESLAIYEDWDYKLRLSRKASFHYTGQLGIGYRRHRRGLSSARGRVHRQHIAKIRRKYGIEGFAGDPMNLMRHSSRMTRLSQILKRNRAA